MVTNKEIAAVLKSNGIKLKRMRRFMKLTQVKLSYNSGISQHHISSIETGKRDYKMSTYIKYLKGLKK